MIYNFTLGTICSLICAILIAWSTFSKNKKDMAKIQIFNPIFGALSNFFLCSYSAVVTNVVNVIRNYLTYKEKINNKITILFIIFYILFGLAFNTKGWIGIFPILASSSYAIFCLKSNNAQILRYGLVLNVELNRLLVNEANSSQNPFTYASCIGVSYSSRRIITFFP